MKRIFTLFTSLALLAFVGCEEDPEHNFNPGGDDTPTTEDPNDNLTEPLNNQIWYTSADGVAQQLNDKSGFNVSVKSNVYRKGRGIITFNGDVTTVGHDAFYLNEKLTSVTLPKSVTTIGENAFYGCEKMSTINFPENLTTIETRAFSGCASLVNIAFGNNLRTIGERAFNSCEQLSVIDFGEGVQEIGTISFAFCTSLTKVTLPESVTTVGDKAFLNCDKLAKFEGKFASEDGKCLVVNGVLNSVAPVDMVDYTIPEGITEIGTNAFMELLSLQSITMPESLEVIGDEAFLYCDNLHTVNLSNNIKSIGISAFEQCLKLKSITIPESVESIGQNAFLLCPSLEEFKGKFASEDGHCLVVDGVLNSFARVGVTDYTTPDEVKVISQAAFWECTELKSMTFSDSVEEIGIAVFSDCLNLKTVTIGKNVNAIGSRAFYDCISLESVYCHPTTPPEAGKSMFVQYNDTVGAYDPLSCTIYVPTQSVDAYKVATNWSAVASQIEGYDF